jgi:hypothetical protein
MQKKVFILSWRYKIFNFTNVEKTIADKDTSSDKILVMNGWNCEEVGIPP